MVGVIVYVLLYIKFTHYLSTLLKNTLWYYYICSRTCYPVRRIEIQRTSRGTLGFSIVGGADSPRGSEDIYVKSVVPSSPASRYSRLKYKLNTLMLLGV